MGAASKCLGHTGIQDEWGMGGQVHCIINGRRSKKGRHKVIECDEERLDKSEQGHGEDNGQPKHGQSDQ